ALGDCVDAVPADQRDGAEAVGPQWQRLFLIAQHDHATGGEPGELLVAAGGIGSWKVLRPATRRAERVNAVSEAQHSEHVFIDIAFVDHSIAYEFHEIASPGGIRAGHD